MFKRALSVLIVLVFILGLSIPAETCKTASYTQIASRNIQEPTAEINIVENADTNPIAHIESLPNDMYYSIYQANIFGDMNILSGLSIAEGSDKVVVAVVDTGVDANHPDLAGKVLTTGYNFVSGNTDISDDNGHGTMISGIIAANSNNGVGIAGATLKCVILPVKVIDANGTGTSNHIAAGIKYAADNGANIINLSFGGAGTMQIVQDAVSYAYSKGCIVIAAAGNEGRSVNWPANCANVVAVGAVKTSNEIASYSNYGSQIALVAVGSDVISTFFSNGTHVYGKSSGTSYAAAYVSSLAALIESKSSKYTPDQVVSIMEQTATHLGTSGRNQYYGYGCINFQAALQLEQADIAAVAKQNLP